MTALPVYTTDTLTIRPWPDEVIDLLGHDPRSRYVETYWLGILGPSTTWLMRRLVTGLEASPSGYELPLSETASCLGLGSKGGGAKVDANGLQLASGVNGAGTKGIWATSANPTFTINVHLNSGSDNTYQGCQSTTNLNWYGAQ